ncbi:auxin-responsive protein SAUR71-like [Phragmites australis]|uniref:auxin-responsive protein SAUR71-like n=1 Tax=Phragmites australis TaxID=29695 RepID=UPI002D790FBB|nr:auxin-responsive protein SAUR71-like [Phragmites australis]
MRQLVRRLSRVGDSSSPPEKRGVGKAPRAGGAVPEGHVPVHVGEGRDDEAERFLVRAELLSRPALADLLGRAAQEYGYDHQGPLRIPCSPDTFRRAIATLHAAPAMMTARQK